MEQPDPADSESLKAFYRQVIVHFGTDSQSDAIIEEAAELIHAICKYRHAVRKGEDTAGVRELVVEEIVDLQIALDQAKLIFSGDSPAAEKRYEECRQKKLASLAEAADIPRKG